MDISNRNQKVNLLLEGIEIDTGSNLDFIQNVLFNYYFLLQSGIPKLSDLDFDIALRFLNAIRKVVLKQKERNILPPEIPEVLEECKLITDTIIQGFKLLLKMLNSEMAENANSFSDALQNIQNLFFQLIQRIMYGRKAICAQCGQLFEFEEDTQKKEGFLGEIYICGECEPSFVKKNYEWSLSKKISFLKRELSLFPKNNPDLQAFLLLRAKIFDLLNSVK